MLTLELLQSTVPSKYKSSITQELVNRINRCFDESTAEFMRENILGYTRVLESGKYKLEDYLSAVTFVSFRLLGYTNKDAYIRTFPARYQRLMDENKTEKEISGYVSAYSKGKLVAAIFEQSYVPTWVLNQDIYQRSINNLFDLSLNAKSELVRVQASGQLLQHLAKPKEVGPLVSIDISGTSAVQG